MWPSHFNVRHASPRAVMKELQKEGMVKYDSVGAHAGRDAGVIAVVDIALAQASSVYVTCQGPRILQCMGCMSGVSRLDAVVRGSRDAAGKPVALNVFRDDVVALAATVEEEKKKA